MTEHSPTPWHKERESELLTDDPCYTISDSTEKPICRVYGIAQEQKAKADIIVLCVNAHDGLVAQCNELAEALMQCNGLLIRAISSKAVPGSLRQDFIALIELCRAALDKAKGETR